VELSQWTFLLLQEAVEAVVTSVEVVVLAVYLDLHRNQLREIRQ
jgi:hypothetical protein